MTTAVTVALMAARRREADLGRVAAQLPVDPEAEAESRPAQPADFLVITNREGAIFIPDKEDSTRGDAKGVGGSIQLTPYGMKNVP